MAAFNKDAIKEVDINDIQINWQANHYHVINLLLVQVDTRVMALGVVRVNGSNLDLCQCLYY